MASGTVKWFNESKGYGFIAPEDGGKDLFVHHSSISGDGFKTLAEGAKVEYESRQGDKGPEATNVVVASSERGASNSGCGRVGGHSRPSTERVVIAEKEAKVEREGEVIEALRNRMYRIQLDNGHETLGYMAGKMKRYRIRIGLGDRVKIELSPYDLERGRIVYRLS